MSDIYSQFLESQNIPCFLLIRNLNFDHDFDLDAPISRGEIIQCSQNIEDLKKIIPQPEIPEDEYKLTLFEKKLGDVRSTLARFDDSPIDISEGEPNDYEIFGESYTVIWVCSPNSEEITDFLVDQYKKKRDLITIWEDYIDRMHVYPFYSLELTSDDFYDKICDIFEKKVNNLSTPPSENEWEELNEYY